MTATKEIATIHSLVSHFRLSQALEWDLSFATGVDRYDKAHKVLFKEEYETVRGRLLELAPRF